MASTLPPPVVIITKCNSTPEISVGYESFPSSNPNKKNTIQLAPTYKHIKSLLTHPPCLHPFKPTLVVMWPCKSCESTFANKFWDAATVLLDYFADFFVKDSALMNAVWFHLFDVWQESAHWFKYREVQQMVDDGEYDENNWQQDNDGILKSAYDKANAFEKVYDDAKYLFELVIWGRRGTGGSHVTQDYELYDPRGEAWAALRSYQTGPWISGIKPWAQFLNNGGPGVSPPSPRSPLETGASKLAPGEVVVAKRYIPHSAIALLKKHVERDHDLFEAHYRNADPEKVDVPTLRYHFDRSCPVFPDHKAPTHSLVSSLLTSDDASLPRRITYTLGNGTPPIVRHPTDRYADEDMQVLSPNWNLMDEAVALCLGIQPYEPMGISDEGPEEDLEDGEDNRVFDMWTVIETRGGEKEKKKKDVFVLGPMFSNFCTVGDVENCLKE